MVTASEARKIVGIAGNVISFGLFLSPLPTFKKIIKQKAVEEFSPVPYVATLLNCALWIFYGLPIISQNNTLVYTINGIGFAIEATYLIIFFIYSPRQKRLQVTMFFALEAAFIGAVVGYVLGVVHDSKKRLQIVGILAVIFGTLMYAAPLTIMRKVVRTKSVKYMPFFLSFVGLLNGICWTSYALFKFDIFVVVPNGIGTALGVAQLALYFCYFKKKEVLPELQMQDGSKVQSTAREETN